jgi:hypothetical protein
MASLATQLSFRSGRCAADPRAEMVGVKGLGDEARQAKWAPKGQGRCRSQARGHSAPHVDRRDRVQLVHEEGRCVARNKEITDSRDGRDKDVPAGTVAVVRSPDTWRAPGGATALSTLIRQRHLTPSCGGHAPTAERTVGPARIVMESLTPKTGIGSRDSWCR